MTLVDEALEAISRYEAREVAKHKEFEEQLRFALKARCYDVLMRQVSLDDITEELAIDVEGLSFTAIPADPVMNSSLGYITACGACKLPLLVPIASIFELGMALRGQQEGLLFCEMVWLAASSRSRAATGSTNDFS